jgi:hypothetical protein
MDFTIKYLIGRTVGIDNLDNFLSISPNQTKFLPSVCLVPGLDFSAILVTIFAVSLGRLSNLLVHFLDFTKWAVSSLSLTHSSNPLSTVNMFISIFVIQILHNFTNS